MNIAKYQINKYRTHINKQLDHDRYLLLITLTQIKATSLLYNSDFIETNPQSYLELLPIDNLVARMKRCFKNEEKYLKSTNCPSCIYEEHKSMHREIERKVNKILKSPNDGELSDALDELILPHLSLDPFLLKDIEILNAALY